jgi:large subunit ribosomal protein L19
VIEKIYPLCFDKFAKIILLDEFKVRKSKIYFLRDKVGKSARLKSIITSDRRNMDLLTLQIMPTIEETTVPAVLIDENLESVSVEAVAGDTETTTNE